MEGRREKRRMEKRNRVRWEREEGRFKIRTGKEEIEVGK